MTGNESKEDEFTKFLQRSPRIPFEHVYQQEGLFSRRFSDNILADVSTNQHKLRNIEEEGKDSKTQYENSADSVNGQHILKMIQVYNKGHHSKFHLNVRKGQVCNIKQEKYKLFRKLTRASL